MNSVLRDGAGRLHFGSQSCAGVQAGAVPVRPSFASDEDPVGG